MTSPPVKRAGAFHSRPTGRLAIDARVQSRRTANRWAFVGLAASSIVAVFLGSLGRSEWVPVGSLSLGPLLTSTNSTSRKTGLVAIWALVLGVAVGFVHHNWSGRDYPLRLIVLSALSILAVWIADRREKAEVTFREAEQRYRILFEKNLYGVIRASFEGTVLDCNDGAARLLGYDSRSELVGKNIKEHYAHPEGRQEIIDAVRRHGPISDQEIEFRRKDGSPMWVLAHVSVVESEGLEPEYVEGVFIDITERKQLQQQLQRSQRMEAIGRLAGGIAHDFNNLLTVIFGHVEIVQSLAGSAPGLRDSLEEIRKSGQRAADLTRQLLAFGRRQVLEPKPLDLNAIVVGMERMLRPLLGEDIHLVDQLEPSLGVVRADPGQIEQVILNLAVNARDAMPKGGFLTLSTENAVVDEDASQSHARVMVPGEYVLLKVTDTGMGMDAATQARVFEPFFTTKAKGKGSGLGLSTAYGIVKQSGGYVWVDSKLGGGTTFRIYLPRVNETITPTEIPTESPKPVAGSERILVVEDEQSIRYIVRRTLERSGYRVNQAASASEALRLAEQNSIDLLLTDIVMPDIDGRTLAAKVRLVSPGVRVLYMSGYTDKALIGENSLESSEAVLPKPFTPDALLRKIREVMEG